MAENPYPTVPPVDKIMEVVRGGAEIPVDWAQALVDEIEYLRQWPSDADRQLLEMEC